MVGGRGGRPPCGRAGRRPVLARLGCGHRLGFRRSGRAGHRCRPVPGHLTDRLPLRSPTLSAAALPTVVGLPYTRLDRLLTAAGVGHGVKQYPDAGHRFPGQIDWREVPLPLVLAGKLSRTRYHEPSAADARACILAFSGRHLRQPEGA